MVVNIVKKSVAVGGVDVADGDGFGKTLAAVIVSALVDRTLLNFGHFDFHDFHKTASHIKFHKSRLMQSVLIYFSVLKRGESLLWSLINMRC
jgi:hypothetical protein